MHLNVGGGGGLRDVEANERQRQQFIVEHGERWWLVVVVDVRQRSGYRGGLALGGWGGGGARESKRRGRISLKSEYCHSGTSTCHTTVTHGKLPGILNLAD
jgi:hypothetical protein